MYGSLPELRPRGDRQAEPDRDREQQEREREAVGHDQRERRCGETKDRTADTVLVPPGASWDTSGTESFDPTRVQRHGEAYSPELKKK